MEVMREELTVPSSDGIHTLSGVIFAPTSAPRGFFHVVHGMTEYIGRYEGFLREMAEEGYVAFGYDHVGHGNTSAPTKDLGFIAHKEGWKLLVRDVKRFSDAVFAKFKKTDAQPYYLMGHSMGSFVARLSAVQTVKPDRLIVMGTGGANPAADPGLALIGIIKRLYGERHISPLMQAMAFGSYNDRFKAELAQAPDPWLTTDAAVRLAYAADPFCSFKFTISAMGDLIRLMKYSNAAAWYRALPTSLPILLISGADDPVGNYGKGVKEVQKKLEQSGHSVTTVLYDGARHEILNDFTHAATVRDIKEFLNA